MRAVVTRVKNASVVIGEKVNGQIGTGFLVLLGVGPNDTEATADKLADKICNLRIFEDENEKMNLNLEQVGVGQMLGANYHYKYPELAKLSQKANAMYVHRRLFTNETHFLTRPRTDGAVFMKAGYPCIDLWALGGGYYHHPKDNIRSINPDILRAATEWLYWTTIFIANK